VVTLVLAKPCVKVTFAAEVEGCDLDSTDELAFESSGFLLPTLNVEVAVGVVEALIIEVEGVVDDDDDGVDGVDVCITLASVVA
jgi:hypothetical protein